MITFDEETHTYTAGGVIVPSVTQIISAAGLYGNTSFYTEESRLRGSYVHQIIEYHLSGELDESTIDESLRPYFDAWLRFVEESKYESEECEKRLAHNYLRYAGTIDHVGHLNGLFSIIDVKTGQSIHPATAIQTAGYSGLLNTYAARFALLLKDDGTYKLQSYKSSEDKDVFLAALNLYYWKQNNLKG